MQINLINPAPRTCQLIAYTCFPLAAGQDLTVSNQPRQVNRRILAIHYGEPPVGPPLPVRSALIQQTLRLLPSLPFSVPTQSCAAVSPRKILWLYHRAVAII